MSSLIWVKYQQSKTQNHCSYSFYVTFSGLLWFHFQVVFPLCQHLPWNHCSYTFYATCLIFPLPGDLPFVSPTQLLFSSLSSSRLCNPSQVTKFIIFDFLYPVHQIRCEILESDFPITISCHRNLGSLQISDNLSSLTICVGVDSQSLVRELKSNIYLQLFRLHTNILWMKLWQKVFNNMIEQVRVSVRPDPTASARSSWPRQAFHGSQGFYTGTTDSSRSLRFIHR